jgi:hypothetical protein
MLKTQRPDRLSEAERAFIACLALNPRESWIVAWCHVELADIYFRTDRDSLATDHCQRAIELDATVNATKNAKRLLSRNRTSDDQYKEWTIVTSEHFRVHCSSAVAPHDTFVAHLVRKYECAYARLKHFWGVEPKDTVQLYLYAPDEMKSQAAVPFHHAFPERQEIHTSTAATYGHELCHLFAFVVNPGQQAKVLAEGIAVVLDQARGPFVIDGEGAKAMETGSVVSVADMVHNFDYERDYACAASFVTYVVREYGSRRFLSLYASSEPLDSAFVATYGVMRATVEAAWRKHLTDVNAIFTEVYQSAELERGQPEKALEKWNQVLSSYGESPDLLTVKARLLNSLGRYEEAVATATIVAASCDNPTIPLWVASEGHVHFADALVALGRVDEARIHYHEAIAIDGADNWADAARRKLAALGRADEHDRSSE